MSDFEYSTGDAEVDDDYDYEAEEAYYAAEFEDYEPNPYDGTYSEE